MGKNRANPHCQPLELVGVTAWYKRSAGAVWSQRCPVRSLSRGPDLPWRIAPVEAFVMFAIKAIHAEEFPSPRSPPADWANVPLPSGARSAGTVQLRQRLSGLNGERGMGECKK
jgi:hypothetical protein